MAGLLHNNAIGTGETHASPEARSSTAARLRDLRDAFAFAYDALRVNKVRTGLTALGMVIGTASVILVSTIALTSRDYILGQIEGVGSNMMYVHLEEGPSVTGTSSISDAITVDDLQAVRAMVPNLRASAAIILAQSPLVLEHRQRDIRLIGTSPDFRIIRNLKVLDGRFFDEEDDQHRNKVGLVTVPLAEMLFPNGWVEGKKIKVRGIEFTIIGVFKEGAETFGQSEITRETVMLPISVMTILTGSDAVDQIYASAVAPSYVPAATREMLDVIRRRHRSGAVYRAENLTEILAAAGNIALALTAVLLLISAIALVISGIGIMNIMLVTVTERTREIGLRMALGASRRAIRRQFLTEALFISIGGGFLGILVGVGIPLTAQSFVEGLHIPISPISISIAFLVSCLVGVIFGILPAERASKLNPTEALHYE
jgi:putative ABC transport system permease protein